MLKTNLLMTKLPLVYLFSVKILYYPCLSFELIVIFVFERVTIGHNSPLMNRNFIIIFNCEFHQSKQSLMLKCFGSTINPQNTYLLLLVYISIIYCHIGPYLLSYKKKSYCQYWGTILTLVIVLTNKMHSEQLFQNFDT